MNHIEQAIKEAVEKGGYKPRYSNISHREHWFGFEERMNLCLPSLYLDPLFWQALGKARGWFNEIGKECLYPNCGNRAFGGTHMHGVGRIQWKEEWHRFIDHLADGKDAESFFATLV